MLNVNIGYLSTGVRSWLMTSSCTRKGTKPRYRALLLNHSLVSATSMTSLPPFSCRSMPCSNRITSYKARAFDSLS
jgi:hypothetical protein